MVEMTSGGNSSQEKNRVLEDHYQASTNFFQSDKVLRHYLKRHLKPEVLNEIRGQLDYAGMQAAGPMNALSYDADKNGPELNRRDMWGNDIWEIRFHPSYKELYAIAVKTGMFRNKWEPSLRKKYSDCLHTVGFAAGQLFAMTELSQYCPHCMTDGAARLVDRFADESDKNRILPHIWIEDAESHYSGAMFLTEKAGGSDVGENQVKATHFRDDFYYLNGEKWFCSNANADMIFVLARTNPEIKGTRGLSIFFVERRLPDGSKNPMEIIRLKDKLGVRSMASAEILLKNTIGKRMGAEHQGFAIMTEMINLSRLYNSVAAVAGSRRALIEAFQFLEARRSFGKIAIEHALVREKMAYLSATWLGNFYLLWNTITALDEADNGDETSKAFVRLMTPIVKKWTAEFGLEIVRESMELMGGTGYIEDTSVPRIMRDMMVLPIWEGAGNIMVLDMLRAILKSNGWQVVHDRLERIIATCSTGKGELTHELKTLSEFVDKMKVMPQEQMEISAGKFNSRLVRLLQACFIWEARDEKSKAWTDPSFSILVEMVSRFSNGEKLQGNCMNVDSVRNMIGWDAGV